jgi:ankyrin repeat protein
MVLGIGQKKKDTEFLYQLRREHWSEALKQLKRGADPDAASEGYNPAIFHLFGGWGAGEKADILDEMITRGANTNIKDTSGQPALHAAIGGRYNAEDFATKLVKAGADVSAVYKDRTALEAAAGCGYWNAVSAMLSAPTAQGLTSAQVLAILPKAAGAAPKDLVRVIVERAGAADFGPALREAVSNRRGETVAYLLAQPGIKCNAAGAGKPLLHIAVEKNDHDIAAQLLKAGADPLKTAKGGQLAAGLATSGEMVRLLAGYGGAPATPDAEGRTPLYLAAQRNNASAVKALLELGAPPDDADKQGQTPLLAAVQAGGLDSVKTLLAHKAAPDLGSSAGLTPLLQAVRSKSKEAVNALLRAGAKAELGDSEGTPLRVAVLLGSEEIALALLKAGASPQQAGSGPLVLEAALRRLPGLARALAAAGADVNATDTDGRTALLTAIDHNDEELVKGLLADGAKPEQAGPLRIAPLEVAVEKNYTGMVKALLEAAGKAETRLALEPALTMAVEKTNTALVEALIAAGADVNIADADGRTPLIKAALKDNVEVMAMLVKAGARVDADDRRGMRAYDHAVTAGKNLSKEFLARCRPGSSSAGGASSGRFVMLNEHSLECRETETLSVIFNFWLQQVIFRDTSQPSPVVVQGFADVPRQEAIAEAYERLKELGGNPPEPGAAALKKKAPGLKAE